MVNKLSKTKKAAAIGAVALILVLICTGFAMGYNHQTMTKNELYNSGSMKIKVNDGAGGSATYTLTGTWHTRPASLGSSTTSANFDSYTDQAKQVDLSLTKTTQVGSAPHVSLSLGTVTYRNTQNGTNLAEYGSTHTIYLDIPIRVTAEEGYEFRSVVYDTPSPATGTTPEFANEWYGTINKDARTTVGSQMPYNGTTKTIHLILNTAALTLRTNNKIKITNLQHTLNFGPVITYNVNNTGSTTTELAVNHGSTVSIASDGSVMDGSTKAYSSSGTGNYNLIDYNYSGFLNVRKTGYHIEGTTDSPPTYNTVWLDKDTNTKYSQTTNYTPSTFTSPKTLYLNWKPNTYTIRYDKNASDANGTLAAQTYTFDATGVSGYAAVTSFSRRGYEFMYWQDEDGLYRIYEEDPFPTNLFYGEGDGSTITLYAQWRDIRKTVTFNPDGGTFRNTTANTSLKVIKGEKDYNQLRTQYGMPARDGYVFKGWYTGRNGAGTQVYDLNGDAVSGTYWNGSGANAKWKYDSNVTLYAYWSRDVAVTFVPNGGTFNGSTGNTTKTLTYGSSTNNNVGPATRTGRYNFLGWYTARTGGTQVYNASGSYVAGDYFTSSGTWKYTDRPTLILYAQWADRPIESHTITLNPDGGKINGSTANQTLSVTQESTNNNTVPIPKKTGNNFDGWYTQRSLGGVRVYDANGSCTTSGGYWSAAGSSGKWQGTGNLTLYARWVERPLYTWTVTYNANGGTGAPAADTKYEDTPLTLSSTRPTWARHRFLKWNTKANGSGTNYAPGASYTANEALTLYAQWEDIPAETYSVTYNANGGTGAPGAQTKTEDVDLVLSSVRPTRDGYTFSKWNTRSNGSGTDYAPGATYTGNAALVLYAMWTEDPASSSPLGTRVIFGVGKSSDSPPPGGTTSQSTAADYGTPANMKGEGYQYELFSGIVPDHIGNAERALKTGYQYNLRSIAFKAGGHYGYHFTGLNGAIGLWQNL